MGKYMFTNFKVIHIFLFGGGGGGRRATQKVISGGGVIKSQEVRRNTMKVSRIKGKIM